MVDRRLWRGALGGLSADPGIRLRTLVDCLAVLGGTAVLFVAAAIFVESASAASPVQIVSATVNADRSVSIGWNIPGGYYGGDLIINPTSATDSTGEMPFGDTTIDYRLFGPGRTHYKTLPLNMTVQQPVTVYVQVQLIDPYDTGRGCQQGAYLVDCDSQVVALTVAPICGKVLVKAGYYSKRMVRRGHWLRRDGHFVRRHGRRVWVKAVYRRVYHPPVYQTRCH